MSSVTSLLWFPCMFLFSLKFRWLQHQSSWTNRWTLILEMPSATFWRQRGPNGAVEVSFDSRTAGIQIQYLYLNRIMLKACSLWGYKCQLYFTYSRALFVFCNSSYCFADVAVPVLGCFAKVPNKLAWTRDQIWLRKLNKCFVAWFYGVDFRCSLFWGLACRVTLDSGLWS